MNTKRTAVIRKANLLLKAVKYYLHFVKYRPLNSVSVLKLKIIILYMNLLALEKSNTIPHKGLWRPPSFVRNTTVDVVYKSAV